MIQLKNRLLSILSVLLITIVLFSACSSGKLTRDKAEFLIKPLFPKQTTGEITIFGSFVKDFCEGSYYVHFRQAAYSKQNKLLDANIINGYTIERVSGCSFEQYQTMLTNEAKKYVVEKVREETKPGKCCKSYLGKYNEHHRVTYEVVTGVFEFKEVTGIRFQKEDTEAIIEYSIQYKSTLFNEFATENRTKFKGDYKFENSSYNAKEIACKYDDGWRLIN